MPEPIEWIQILEPKLDKRRGTMELFEQYYEGEHPLPFLTQSHSSKMLDEFARLLRESKTNFMRLVVDVVAERLKVEGIRLSASSDAETDKDSWDVWQANHFDTESGVAILDSLIKGCSYISVWEGDDYPVMAVEDPCETIVHYAAGSGYRYRDAALKRWEDETGRERVNVYLEDGIYKFIGKERQDDSYYLGNLPGYGVPSNENRWEELEDEFVENPVGVVPIVPLRNRPRVRCEGESELRDQVSTQNQINGMLFLLALAGYFGAHKQRWASGIPIAEDANGKPIEPFETDVSKLWVAEDETAKFGEFQQTDLDGYIKAIEQKVLHIAVTTRTPRHYLIEMGQSPSGDAIKSAESGLIKKCEAKQNPLGEGFEEALLLARQFMGDDADAVDSEIVWADPATPTVAETTDAVIKQFQSGLIPREVALEKLGYTQTQIARMMGQFTTESLLALPPVSPGGLLAPNGTSQTPAAVLPGVLA